MTGAGESGVAGAGALGRGPMDAMRALWKRGSVDSELSEDRREPSSLQPTAVLTVSSGSVKDRMRDREWNAVLRSPEMPCAMPRGPAAALQAAADSLRYGTAMSSCRYT